jgi:cell division protein FtsL
VTIAVSLILGTAILVGILLEQVILAQSAFELSSLRKSLTIEEARHEELLMEAAKLDNAARIERFARQSLGMAEPAPGHIHYVVADVRTGNALAGSSVGSRPIALRRAGATHLGSVTASGAGYGGTSP